MTEIAQVGIVGAGLMGRGLALFLPQRGYHVTLCTRRDPATITDDCWETLRGLVARGVLTSETADAVRGRLTVTDDMDALRSAHLVLECVEENDTRKREVLARLSLCCPPPALLATLSSTLRISDLASHVHHPKRFLGLHFLSPVASTKLVEVAPGADTDPTCLARAVKFVEALDKLPLVVRDTPGFIVNRLLLELCNRALALVEEETAAPEAIDTALRLGCAHPMGPLELGDAIGWDIVLASLAHLHRATGDDAYAPRPLLRRLVAAGHLGRKVGRGVYSYNRPGGRRLDLPAPPPHPLLHGATP